MPKPENNFITSVQKYLQPIRHPHREKMHNPYRGGCADVWYSGDARDFWIEYKFIVVPVRDDTIIKIDCSPLQIEWLRDRREEGRKVFVIVGSKAGGMLFKDLAWEKPLTAAAYRAGIQTRAQLADWIERYSMER